MLEKIIVCEQQVITHDITTIDNFMNKRYRIKLFSPILKPGLKWHALKVNGSTLESVYAPHFVVNDTEGLTYHETPAGAFYTMPAKYVPEAVVKERVDVKLSELGFLVVDDLYQYTTERDSGKNFKTAISNLVKRMMVYLTMSAFQRDGMLIGECGLTVRDSTEYVGMFRIDNLEFFLFEHF